MQERRLERRVVGRQHTASPIGQPGWHRDPWHQAHWRWFDGQTWTIHVSDQQASPRKPRWTSLPVLISAVLVVPVLIGVLLTSPLSIVLSIVPMFIVLPVMLWLDRVEPEPRPALVHAFLWGATVAALISIVVNSTTAALAGQNWAIVVSAPFVEEITKAGAIVWAVRRHELDGVMDGVVYAGWAGLGFAVVEDVSYFAEATSPGQLAATFLVRAVLAPFAHPLFTAWTGLAIGRAVALGRPLLPSALGGIALAIASHMAWNGSIVAAGVWSDAALVIIGTGVLAFVALFVTFAVVLYRARRREERRFVQLIPWLAQRYGVPVGELHPLGDFRSLLAQRRSLGGAERRRYDAVHAALARLAVLHDRPGPTDQATEQVLVDQLRHARGMSPH